MIGLLLVLVLIGFLTHLIVTYVPMPDVFRKAIIFIVIILVILYAVQILGIGDIAIPHYRY